VKKDTCGQAPEKPCWTDSHNHLAMDDFDGERDRLVQGAKEAGVERMVLVGTTPDDWDDSAALAASHGFRHSAGLHPHEASMWDGTVRARLDDALARGAAAVGEIGLDYHYDLSPRDVQRAVFEDQLAVAAERGLPVIVHSREAFEDTVAAMRPFLPSLKGVIHCFTYGPAEAEAFVALGLHLSFSGIVTFKNAPLIREAARIAPLERILVETDAPYLAPVPHRGKRCEPAHAAVVGAFLADLLGRDEVAFAAATSANAAALFGF
jgi:TatD DNase family protein